jgi:glycosyltransferase involved in cell wall biosynthesis
MKITTIIVSLNAINHIQGAIDSFMKQDYQNKELILFDGMSTDGTHNIIKQNIEKYPNIVKWISNEQDNGISQARNRALKHATGDYIGFLGADDRLMPGIFTKIKEYYDLADLGDVDVIYFDSYWKFDTQNKKSFSLAIYNDFLFNIRYARTSSIAFTMNNFLRYFSFAPGEAFYYYKDIFNQYSFNEQNKTCMDYEFNLILTDQKKNCSYIAINSVGLFFNHHHNNISTRLDKEQSLLALSLRRKYLIKYKLYLLLLADFMKFILLPFIIKTIKSMKNIFYGTYNKFKS